MVLAIGPTGVYLILAVLFLIVLGGGIYMVYRMNHGQASRSTGDKGDSGSRRR